MHRALVERKQVAGNLLQLNQGTLYPALVRLEQQGRIKGTWGKTESNREAKFYAITRTGEKTLAEETREFQIDVNAIAPGALNTRMLDEVLAAGPDRVGRVSWRQHPVSRRAQDLVGHVTNKSVVF